MKSTCKEIRERAWDALRIGYWQLFVLLLIVAIVASVLSSFSFGALSLLVLPMQFACSVAALKLVREQEVPRVESLIEVYKTNLEKGFLVPFLRTLFVFLWSLLLIIPGIIMAYAYSMAVFVSNDNPELSAMDAIKKSRELMNGHKWDLFVLDLSFIGWILLACLTAGIGFIFLQPYIDAAHAEFYREITENGAEAKAENVPTDLTD